MVLKARRPGHKECNIQGTVQLLRTCKIVHRSTLQLHWHTGDENDQGQTPVTLDDWSWPELGFNAYTRPQYITGNVIIRSKLLETVGWPQSLPYQLYGCCITQNHAAQRIYLSWVMELSNSQCGLADILMWGVSSLIITALVEVEE